MATNLNKLFVFVANSNVEAFISAHEGQTSDAYSKKIAFLSGTGEIMTHGERFAINSNTDLTALQTLIGTNLDLSSNLTAETVIGAINEIFELVEANTTSINTINSSIGDDNSGIVQQINTINSSIGDSNSGIVQQINTINSSIGDANSGLTKQIADLETTVGDNNSGLVATINTLTANESSEGSIDYKIAQAKKEILTGDSQETIDQAYDTLLEIANWIQNDSTGAAAVADQVSQNTQDILDISAIVYDLSVNKTTVITNAINDLDSSVTLSGNTVTDPATVNYNSSIEVLGGIKIIEENGLLDYVNSSKVVLKADAAGAAANVYEVLLGTDEDTLASNTIKGLKSAIAAIDVSAIGETGNSSLIIATASNNTVTVTSSDKLQNAVGLAETALQELTVISADSSALSISGSPVSNNSHELTFTLNKGNITVDGSVNTLKYTAGDENKLVSVKNIVDAVNSIEMWEDITS